MPQASNSRIRPLHLSSRRHFLFHVQVPKLSTVQLTPLLVALFCFVLPLSPGVNPRPFLCFRNDLVSSFSHQKLSFPTYQAPSVHVMVSLWPFGVRNHKASTPLYKLKRLMYNRAGRRQLPRLLRKNPLHSLDQNHTCHLPPRPSPPACPPLQGPLDPLHLLHLPSLHRYSRARARMAKLGCEGICRYPRRTRHVRSLLQYNRVCISPLITKPASMQSAQ